MPTRPNLNFSLMGSTNMVQPYCRLAIATMPRMPMSSWNHRRLSMETAGRTAGVDALAICMLLWQILGQRCVGVAYTGAVRLTIGDIPDACIRDMLISNCPYGDLCGLGIPPSFVHTRYSLPRTS